MKRLGILLLTLSLLLGLLPNALMEAQPDLLRVTYQNEENDYQDLGLWLWGDVVTPSEKTGAWPGGRSVFPQENITDSGAFLDVPLVKDAKQVGLLVIDGQGNKKTGEDLLIDLLSPDMNQVYVNDQLEVSYEDLRKIPEGHLRVRFLKEDGQYEGLGVWFWGDVVTASEKSGPWPTGATPMTPASDALGAYVDIALTKDAKQVGFLFVNRESGEQTADYVLPLTPKTRVVYVKQGEDTVKTNPYQEEAAMETAAQAPIIPWQEIDALYATDAPLGPVLHEDGSATLRLWAPTADAVEVVLYAPSLPNLVLRDGLLMTRGDKGVFSITLNDQNTPLKDLKGSLYHFRVKRGGQERLVLDPYAPSMAAWNSQGGETVGKAAIVDPKAVGPQLDFARIPGFEKREDAIIYEAHVRDFTSDPSIKGELKAPFGTFLAMAERLDYLKDLGVTHIQLLPVLNFYHVNELDREREMDYESQGQNYNWGYDPQSYFALTGMYATKPQDPENRIDEFKQLVKAIHDRGMGVILDVVYNHTAKIELLEDIQPNYYYFMDKQGKPKGSFGGGQVGSTHRMTRRLITDSLLFLTETYKVDGFRFDMMGNLDADTLLLAYEQVSSINPDTLWIGEGWRTFNGDAGEPQVTPLDQDFMDSTDALSVFSDEVRNELKSGYGIEGQPRFLTGGARPTQVLLDNVQARPQNVTEDDPGDIVQYIEAHDNLTLFDVIALSIKKDPALHEQEILRRVRLGNAFLLTHQGIIFLHAGQEYGRTKQFLHPDFKGKVINPPDKSTFMADEQGQPFLYPYFIHDSFDSSDAVNRFDWDKVNHSPEHRLTVDYTRGLIELRRKTDAFRLKDAQEVERWVKPLRSPDIQDHDLLFAFTAQSGQEGERFLVIINADHQPRSLNLKDQGLLMDEITVLVDGARAGTQPLSDLVGVSFKDDEGQVLLSVELAPLTATVMNFGRTAP